jgi:hypothetical protein
MARRYDSEAAWYRSKYWAMCLRGHRAKLRGEETFPVWHGRRIKNVSSAKKRGIGSKKLSVVHLKRELMDAIDFAGKSDLVEDREEVRCLGKYRRGSGKDFDCQRINMASEEFNHPWRKSIFVSARKDHPETACSWARRNPEIIFLLLQSLMQIYRTDKAKPLFDYMERKYGKPYAIRLDCDFSDEETNFSMYRKWIAPEEIKEIVKCESSRSKYV